MSIDTKGGPASGKRFRVIQVDKYPTAINLVRLFIYGQVHTNFQPTASHAVGAHRDGRVLSRTAMQANNAPVKAACWAARSPVVWAAT